MRPVVMARMIVAGVVFMRPVVMARVIVTRVIVVRPVHGPHGHGPKARAPGIALPVMHHYSPLLIL